MPGYERTPVDEALAEELIGPYVQELNASFVLDNTTYYASRMDGSVSCCFNRIIDTEQIASFEWAGSRILGGYSILPVRE